MLTKFEDTQEDKDKFINNKRNFYYNSIRAWYFKNISKHDKDYNYLDMLSNCTILQLQSIYENFVVHDSPILLLGRCNPKDHAVIYLGSMYVGIEPDGYAHS